MNPRIASYSRLRPEYESLQVDATREPLEHNLDVKKLQSRCCLCISAALLIAFALWMFDPPAGRGAKPDPSNTGTQLKFVAALHRHGARSSLHSYSFEKEIEWDVGQGKLLDVGFRQGFEFGRQLRSRYWSRLSSFFDSSIKCVSTDVDRTVDTANSVLLGLVTDNKTEIGDANCTCRPKDWSRSTPKCAAKCIGVPYSPFADVEIWDEESEEGTILQQFDTCKGMNEWKKHIFASNEYKNARNSTFEEAFQYAENLAGNSTLCSEDGIDCHEMKLRDLYRMYDTALCLAAQQGSNNGPYEDIDEVEDKLHDAATSYFHQIYSDEIGPSIGGILLDHIISELEKGAKRKPPGSYRSEQLSPPTKAPFMVLYSAHDSTIASLLAAMEVTDWHFPEFTSHLVFELFGPKDPSTKALPNNHYIRILYDNEELIVGDCMDSFCPLKTFTDSQHDRRRTVDDCVRVPS